ncbi:MAG: SurA N-terminal domain-containing protein [Armatimonadetes bacterium]|nr:SurA N-terminal domain-containing protein [Armatimonadota bacterium]
MAGITVRSIRNTLRKKGVRWLVVIGALIVALSMVSLWSGPTDLMGGQNGNAIQDREVIATVGKESIYGEEVMKIVRQNQQFNPSSGPASELQSIDQAINQLAYQKAFVQAAKKAGMLASGREVDAFKEKTFRDQLASYRASLLKDGKGTDADLDKEMKKQYGMSLADLEKRFMEQDETMFVLQATQQKWIDSLKSKYLPNDEQLKLSYDEVETARIVLNSDKRSVEEAKKKAEEAKAAVAGGMKFEEAVKKFSDDVDFIKNQKGIIDKGRYGDVQNMLGYRLKPEDVGKILALPVNGTSDLIEASDGKSFFLYQMVSRKPNLPKDFEEKKKEYAEQYANQRAQQEFFKSTSTATQEYKTDIKIPLIKAYRDWKMNPHPMAAEKMKAGTAALKAIDESLSQPRWSIMARFLQIEVLKELAALPADEKQKAEYNDQLLGALRAFFNEGGAEDAELRILFAERLLANKEEKAAKDSLEIALANAYKPEHFGLAERIGEVAKKHNMSELAKEATDKRKDLFDQMVKQRAEEQKAMMEQQAQQKKMAEEAAKANKANQAK